MGVADVRLHLLVHIAGHHIVLHHQYIRSCSRLIMLVHPMVQEHHVVLNTPQNDLFSHFVALRSASVTHQSAGMDDCGLSIVLLSTLTMQSLRRLTATTGYQVHARCRPSGWPPDLHRSRLSSRSRSSDFSASRLLGSVIPASCQLFSELPFRS